MPTSARLHLSREIVRHLDDPRLADAAGASANAPKITKDGFPCPTDQAICPSANCSILDGVCAVIDEIKRLV